MAGSQFVFKLLSKGFSSFVLGLEKKNSYFSAATVRHKYVFIVVLPLLVIFSRSFNLLFSVRLVLLVLYYDTADAWTPACYVSLP